MKEPIEYTYPEQRPTGAKVRGEKYGYNLSTLDGSGIHLSSTVIDNSVVPLVAEAMMTLAGHEWPTADEARAKLTASHIDALAAEDAVQATGMRILARLSQRQHGAQSVEGLAYEWARQIVREECGL